MSLINLVIWFFSLLVLFAPNCNSSEPISVSNPIWDIVWHELFDFLLTNNFSNFNPPDPSKNISACGSFDEQWRRHDGSCNNLQHPGWGMTGSMLRRLGPISYLDGYGDLMKPINARNISNLLYGGWNPSNTLPEPSQALSQLEFAMGQFFLHDLIMLNMNYSEPAYIEVPESNSSIPFWRNAVFPGTGTGPGNPRQYANAITQWIDLNTVYGSSDEVAALLRANDGTGRLRTGADGISLPIATADDLKIQPMQTAFDSATRPSKMLYLAGDIRANQNFNLLAFHTLFLREHNRRANLLKVENPQWDEEMLYQKARQLTIATWQSLLIHEFTATLGGLSGAERSIFDSFDSFIESHQLNELNPMAHVAWDILYRLHPTIDDVRLCNDTWCSISPANVSLGQMFFNPVGFSNMDLDSYLLGLANTPARKIGPHMSDAMRDVQVPMGPQRTNVTVFDLAAYDLQRIVDLGVGSINDVRSIYHLPPVTQWSDLTTDEYTLSKLQSVYSSVEQVDGLSGAFAEDPFSIPLISQAAFGPSIFRTIGYQAAVYSLSDRFFYLRPGWLTAEELKEINSVHLSDVIVRNTNIQCMPLDSTFYRRDSSTTGPSC